MSTLEDKQSLYELMCLYCKYIDCKEYSNIRSLYSPNARHDHGDIFNGSPEQFISFLEQSMGSITTHHFIGNHLYSVNGDEATGELHTIITHISLSTSPPHEYTAGCRFFDYYRRQNGSWKIVHRRRLLDWTQCWYIDKFVTSYISYCPFLFLQVIQVYPHTHCSKIWLDI